MIKILLVFALLFFVSLNVFTQNYDETKKNIINSIENHEEEIIKISDKIWELAETAFNEYESSKLLSDYAEANGFSLERGVVVMCLLHLLPHMEKVDLL